MLVLFFSVYWKTFITISVLFLRNSSKIELFIWFFDNLPSWTVVCVTTSIYDRFFLFVSWINILHGQSLDSSKINYDHIIHLIIGVYIKHDQSFFSLIFFQDNIIQFFPDMHSSKSVVFSIGGYTWIYHSVCFLFSWIVIAHDQSFVWSIVIADQIFLFVCGTNIVHDQSFNLTIIK